MSSATAIPGRNKRNQAPRRKLSRFHGDQMSSSGKSRGF